MSFTDLEIVLLLGLAVLLCINWHLGRRIKQLLFAVAATHHSVVAVVDFGAKFYRDETGAIRIKFPRVSSEETNELNDLKDKP